MLNGPDLTRLLDRRDRRSHDSALQSTPCRFAPAGRIPSPRGGRWIRNCNKAIPKTDEGKMSQIFAWFPLISQRLVPRRCQLPPKGKPWRLRRGSKKRTQSIRIFIRPVCAHLEIFSGYLVLFWAAAAQSPDPVNRFCTIATTPFFCIFLVYHIDE
jgi:hypothetical protein